MARPVHLRVALQRDADGYPPFDSEEVDAELIDDSTAAVTAAPAFAPGLAVGDVVAVSTSEDGDLWITEVTTESDHWTTRVIPLDGQELTAIVEALNARGADARPTQYGLVVCDVPPHVDAGGLVAYLEQGRDGGDWDFDLGVDPRR